MTEILSAALPSEPADQDYEDFFLCADVILSEFKKGDDAEALTELRSLRAQIDELSAEKQRKLKETIQYFCQEVEHLRKKTSMPPITALKKEMEELQSAEKEIENKIEQYEDQITEKTQKIDDIKEKKEDLQVKLEQLQKEKQKKLPTDASTVGLYQTSTEIVWKESAANGKKGEEEESQASGTFYFQDPPRIIPFSFPVESASQPKNSTKNGEKVKSKFEIANRLWEIMWENTGKLQEEDEEEQ